MIHHTVNRTYVTYVISFRICRTLVPLHMDSLQRLCSRRGRLIVAAGLSFLPDHRPHPDLLSIRPDHDGAGFSGLEDLRTGFFQSFLHFRCRMAVAVLSSIGEHCDRRGQGFYKSFP